MENFKANKNFFVVCIMLLLFGVLLVGSLTSKQERETVSTEKNQAKQSHISLRIINHI